MSSETLDPAVAERPPANTRKRVRSRRRASPYVTLAAHGQPMIWLTGGALAVALAMILTLLAKVVWEGIGTFWPVEVVQVTLLDGKRLMGEIAARERYRPTAEEIEAMPAEVAKIAKERVESADGWAERESIRTGNFELTGTHFTWVGDFLIRETDRPQWACVVERLGDVDRSATGRFYGFPEAFLRDGEIAAQGPAASWQEFERFQGEVQARRRQKLALEKHDRGEVLRKRKAASLVVKQAELDHGPESPTVQDARLRQQQVEDATAADLDRINREIQELDEENLRYRLRFATADGATSEIALADIVRAYPANQLTWTEKLSVYGSRWREFLWDDPRNANSEGGVFPCIWGTLAMTVIMSLLVVPFGVLAALFLREYAKSGPLISAVRIAINNLAGVPSIVFGVFGLGFFCYVLGASIDQWFFQAQLADSNTPTFGTGGLLWASLTLALLTLPVVIVATEEALAAVPNSMREGSYACGASKWQTIRRIVLPRALPGIMTGAILAMARGAGEVAPLMLVGVMKIAPELPVDGVFPYVHPQRSFMHLGFHIYDSAFQSPNSEAAKPMVYTTTLLLIGLIAALNLLATFLRARLRRRYVSNQF